MKKLLTACLFLVSGSINAGVVSVINGTHDVINGSSSGDLGLTGLGHTSTLYSNNTNAWNSALSSGADAIVVEQGAFNASTTNIQSFLNGGGRMIVLGDFHADTFMNSILGSTMNFNYYHKAYGTTVASKTAAATGTTFTNDATDLAFLSSTHSVLSGAETLAAGSEVYYDGLYGPQVFRTSYGQGDLFYIGWDFAGAGTSAQRNDYYEVLDSAINFESVTVSEPLTIALLGLGVTGIAATRRRKIA